MIAPNENPVIEPNHARPQARADLGSGARHKVPPICSVKNDLPAESSIISFANGRLTIIRVVEPVSDRMAYVLMSVVLTNQVSNTNLSSSPLTLGLGTGAPTRAQARSTNAITVWMTDSGSPRVNATNAFNMAVDDCLELFLGQSVLRVGQTGSVPVSLVTTTGLTNLETLVDIPDDRLAPLALTELGPGVGSATLQQQAPNLWQIDFTAAPGAALQATQELARLSFLAVTNRSAFVPLTMEFSTNLTTEGMSVWRALVDNGRGVVIEQESLLEALPLTNGLSQPDVVRNIRCQLQNPVRPSSSCDGMAASMAWNHPHQPLPPGNRPDQHRTGHVLARAGKRRAIIIPEEISLGANGWPSPNEVLMPPNNCSMTQLCVKGAEFARTRLFCLGTARV